MQGKNSNYQLLDSGDREKLEQMGPYRLIRHAPQAIWPKKLSSKEWSKADARFVRDRQGTGDWSTSGKKLPPRWNVEIAGVQVLVELTQHGHVGIFPEHHALQPHIKDFLKGRPSPTRALNLFAYTGIMSIFLAQEGCEVVHLDASKKSVQWAKENSQLAGTGDKPIRYITDHVLKFIKREQKRGSQYDLIILDPPSYGRGAKGEVFKIEEHLIPMLEDLSQLLTKTGMVILSCHTPGFSPTILMRLLETSFPKGTLEGFELVAKETTGQLLPSGNCALYRRSN